jgi:hypothetical protein
VLEEVVKETGMSMPLFNANMDYLNVHCSQEKSDELIETSNSWIVHSVKLVKAGIFF